MKKSYNNRKMKRKLDLIVIWIDLWYLQQKYSHFFTLNFRRQRTILARVIQNIKLFLTIRMAQLQMNNNSKVRVSVQPQIRSSPQETKKIALSQSSNKTNQILHTQIKNGKIQNSVLNSENQYNSQVEKGDIYQHDLDVLETQIAKLKPIQKQQAKLRFQSQAYVCRKRRGNLFRAYEKKMEKPNFLNLQSKGCIFDCFMNRKHSSKSSLKIQKLLNNFLPREISQNNRQRYFLEVYTNKQKNGPEKNRFIRDSLIGYTENDISKIKKYRVDVEKNPPLGYIFCQDSSKKEETNYENYAQQQLNNEDAVIGFDEIPQTHGYIQPQQPIQNVFIDTKRHIFKLARTMIRTKLQKQNILKRIAYMAVKEVERRYIRSQRNQAQFYNRAKKLQRECVIYWRKRQKQLIQLRKRKEKLEAQLKKRDQEEQQALRQEKRLQYIMYQSGLYSHFMATKLGTQGQMKKDVNGLIQIDNKKVQIDQEAAQLAVNQIITNKAQNLEKFDKPGKLDFSSVEGNDSQLLGPPPIFKGVLKQYQIKGLRWLNHLFEAGINGILADQMGLGKTIQAIALLSHISYVKNVWGPFLIVAPNSTLFNWQQQFKKFCPSLRVLPYWGSIKQRKTIRKFFSEKKFSEKADSPFHVVITSYQLTVTDQKAFKRLKWQFMILDEAQAIKNVLSQRWNTLKQFQSRNRLLLTGTPIQNNMAELWALLNFIMPELFDSHQLFNQWFSKDIEAHSQDQKALDQIKIQRLHGILKPFMLRRIKKDVQHQIGKKIEHQILCEMTKRQKHLYDSIKEKLNLKQFFKMLQSKIKVENLMNLVMQLRKVCNHPELFQRRPPRSPFLFQQLYYYTGYIPIRVGQQKLISYNSKNPIVYGLPKIVYESFRYQQPLHKRNKRLLDIYRVDNQINNKTFSCTRLTSLSYNQVQIVSRQDPLFTQLLLLHWKKNLASYGGTFSTKSYIDFTTLCLQKNDRQWQNIFSLNEKFMLPQKYIKSLVNTYIISATAPLIIPTISSWSFYNQHELLTNNTFQKYIFEGKYKNQYTQKYSLPQHEGLLTCRQQLTKIQVIDFGSLIADSAKLRQLDRILKEKKKSDGRVLIFCQMTKMLDILEDFMNMRKYTFFRLDGGSNLADRRDMVNEFQVNNKIFVFLLSTRAGGLGVTLTAANTVIFYDNDWNPTMDAQATDRAHRIGQRNDVFVYQLVTKGTIEERIVKRAQQKKTVQSTVYEGASFNFFKKEMIIELMCDQFNGIGEDPKKKDSQPKKKGPKPKNKQEQQREKKKQA